MKKTLLGSLAVFLLYGAGFSIMFLPLRQAGQSALRLASLPAYGAKTPSSIQYLPVKLRFSPRPLSTSMSSVALAKEEALAAAGLRLGGEDFVKRQAATARAPSSLRPGHGWRSFSSRRPVSRTGNKVIRDRRYFPMDHLPAFGLPRGKARRTFPASDSSFATNR